MRCCLVVPALFPLAMLAACGEGYELVPARLNVAVPDGSFLPVEASVRDVLIREGFEDLGKYDEMIALTKNDTAMPEEMKREQLERLERERTYLNRKHDLRVVISDFSKGVPPEIRLRYRPLSDRFVELDVFDERPGGFGSYGMSFYDRFLSTLKQKYGDSVRVVDPPPPTNDAEYRRITTKNSIAAVLAWGLAFALPLLITASLSRYVLQKLKISTLLKRIIFVVANTWLVAPLPFPAAFIFVMPAPNLLAFPWTSTDYYSRVASYAVVSFPVTLVLCTVIAIFLFKKNVPPVIDRTAIS